MQRILGWVVMGFAVYMLKIKLTKIFSPLILMELMSGLIVYVPMGMTVGQRAMLNVQHALVPQTHNVLLVVVATSYLVTLVHQLVQLENGRLQVIHVRIVLQVAPLAVTQVMFVQNACLIMILAVFRLIITSKVILVQPHVPVNTLEMKVIQITLFALHVLQDVLPAAEQHPTARVV
ncbi:MAG: hypothetical protein QF704_16150 [Anaerolineales bacterium]|nr:hypothetical protein [Anaerolineales bacterium]